MVLDRGSVKFALIGLENQTRIDPCMPMRVLNYDGVSYRSQLLTKGAKKYPVITLVLYFGEQPWSGPRTLYECVDVPEDLKDFVSDYRINVIDIASLPRNTIKKFKSDFRVAADYFWQHRNNKDYKLSRSL